MKNVFMNLWWHLILLLTWNVIETWSWQTDDQYDGCWMNWLALEGLSLVLVTHLWPPCRWGHWLCGQWDHYERWGTDPADDDGEREDDHSGGGAGTGKAPLTPNNNANELPLLTFMCTNFTHPERFRPAPFFLQNTHAHSYIHSHAFKHMRTDTGIYGCSRFLSANHVEVKEGLWYLISEVGLVGVGWIDLFCSFSFVQMCLVDCRSLFLSVIVFWEHDND